jgi:DNA repair exonuclease SbcCD ATPase subunit
MEGTYGEVRCENYISSQLVLSSLASSIVANLQNDIQYLQRRLQEQKEKKKRYKNMLNSSKSSDDENRMDIASRIKEEIEKLKNKMKEQQRKYLEAKNMCRKLQQENEELTRKLEHIFPNQSDSSDLDEKAKKLKEWEDDLKRREELMVNSQESWKQDIENRTDVLLDALVKKLEILEGRLKREAALRQKLALRNLELELNIPSELQENSYKLEKMDASALDFNPIQDKHTMQILKEIERDESKRDGDEPKKSARSNLLKSRDGSKFLPKEKATRIKKAMDLSYLKKKLEQMEANGLLKSES